MEEMIDRVAKAIFQRTDPKWDWDNSTDFIKRETREIARAAIEAMLEPTDAMEYAGATVADNIANVEAELCWKAMISEALSPSTRGE